MATIKFTSQHPAFQRVEAKIERHLEKVRPATIEMAIQKIRARPALLIGRPIHEAIAEVAYQIELSMMKRMGRYYGLAGKYVAH